MKRIWIIFIFLAFFFFTCIGCKPAPTAVLPNKIEDTPRMAILSAFQPELTKLLKETDIQSTYALNGHTVYAGKLSGNDVLLTLSGVSMVNAAMMTQALIDHFNVERIIFSGIAGGVNPDLHIGDVTIPSRWGQYQENLFARKMGQGWDTLRYSDDFGNFGMMFPQPVEIYQEGAKLDQPENKFWFPVDTKMLEVAKQAAAHTDLKRCVLKVKCLSYEPQVIAGGNGLSGPTFVDNAEYRQWVWETFEADALDMETAAAAHVAYVNNIPFIAFRSLSDLAGGGENSNELAIFYQLAADNSAEMVVRFLELWKERPS